jgi:hypothetical protein
MPASRRYEPNKSVVLLVDSCLLIMDHCRWTAAQGQAPTNPCGAEAHGEALRPVQDCGSCEWLVGAQVYIDHDNIAEIVARHPVPDRPARMASGSWSFGQPSSD